MAARKRDAPDAPFVPVLVPRPAQPPGHTLASAGGRYARGAAEPLPAGFTTVAPYIPDDDLDGYCADLDSDLDPLGHGGGITDDEAEVGHAVGARRPTTIVPGTDPYCLHVDTRALLRNPRAGEVFTESFGWLPRPAAQPVQLDGINFRSAAGAAPGPPEALGPTGGDGPGRVSEPGSEGPGSVVAVSSASSSASSSSDPGAAGADGEDPEPGGDATDTDLDDAALAVAQLPGPPAAGAGADDAEADLDDAALASALPPGPPAVVPPPRDEVPLAVPFNRRHFARRLGAVWVGGVRRVWVAPGDAPRHDDLVRLFGPGTGVANEAERREAQRALEAGRRAHWADEQAGLGDLVAARVHEGRLG